MILPLRSLAPGGPGQPRLVSQMRGGGSDLLALGRVHEPTVGCDCRGPLLWSAATPGERLHLGLPKQFTAQERGGGAAHGWGSANPASRPTALTFLRDHPQEIGRNPKDHPLPLTPGGRTDGFLRLGRGPGRDGGGFHRGEIPGEFSLTPAHAQLHAHLDSTAAPLLPRAGGFHAGANTPESRRGSALSASLLLTSPGWVV